MSGVPTVGRIDGVLSTLLVDVLTKTIDFTFL